MFYKLILLSCFFTLHTLASAETQLSKINKTLQKSISSDLFVIKKSGRYIQIQIDRSLQPEYKNQLHSWLHSRAKVDKDFRKVHLTWKPKPFLLSKVSLTSFSLTLLGLIVFLFSALKLLSLKNNNLSEEEQVTLLVEKKVESDLMKKIIPPPSRKLDYNERIEYF